MSKKKVHTLIKGYLLKDKMQTIVIGIFLSIMVAIFLIGNQMFDNVEQVNRINAQSLAGKQHVIYYDVPEERIKVIEDLSYVKSVGKGTAIGDLKDGTGLGYIDENNRELRAEITHKNIKSVKQGHWPQIKNEVVFTENYMELYDLKIGDTVEVTIKKHDSQGELVYTVKNQTLHIVGVIDNKPGFTDEKAGYVSKELVKEHKKKYLKKQGGEYLVSVELKSDKNIGKQIDQITEKIGYTDIPGKVNKNVMLMQCVRYGWEEQCKRIGMNGILWLICILVIYHIFNSRFEHRRKEFGVLRGLGFERKDLRYLLCGEMVIFMVFALVAGLCEGIIINRMIYQKLIFAMLEQYDTNHLLTSNLTGGSIIITVVMMVSVCIPVLVVNMMGMKNISPINSMKEAIDKHIRIPKKRNKKVKNNLYGYTLIMMQQNRNKKNITITIVILAVTLICGMAYQRNGSDNGIKYVKEYIPDDLQLTIGNRAGEFAAGRESASFSRKCVEKIRRLPSVKRIQTYALMDDLFLCSKKGDLDKRERKEKLDEESMSEIKDDQRHMIYKIGKDDYYYLNINVAATNDMGKLLHGEDRKNTHGVIMPDYLCKVFKLSLGDKFRIYDGSVMSAEDINEAKSVEVEVLDTEGLTILSEEYLGPNIIITDEETAKKIADKLDYKVINIEVKEGKEGKALYELNSMPELRDASIRSAYESMKSFKESNSTQEAIRYIFVILLMAIALIIYMNAIFANLLSRVKELAMLHKIGVRVGEMYRMILQEGFSYSRASVVFLLFIQSGFFIFDRYTEKFIITWGMIYLFLLIDVGVFIVCSGVPVMLFRYIHNKNWIYVRKK